MLPAVRSRKVLLVAMSGVRVADPGLRALGLTLPGFVERGQVIASLPSLGLLTIAAHTPPHWAVEYREIDALTDADFRAIADGRYDLVAVSSLTARITDAYRLADHLRAVGTTVVLGGLHATALPDEALGHVDAVIRGQGEGAWPVLLDDLERGALRRVYTSFGQDGLAHRLEHSRVPRYELLTPDLYNRLPLQTTRGCPRDCVFCGSSRLLGPYQVKPIPMIRRELERILELWPRPFIELADDNTFVERSWSRELAALLAEHHVRWFTETDLTLADDERLLELLARAGCAQVLIGLESVTSPALRGIDSAGWKARRAASALDAVRRIQSHGIAVNGCFVLGLDGDDAGAFDRVAAFVDEAELCDVQITLLTPFPGTGLYRELRSKGRLLRETFWDECTLFDVTYRPETMSADELRSRFCDLMRRLYGPEATHRRRARWRALHRETHGTEREGEA
jgi:radical SAM superfamily enzyme YgiQ (UPF0313 family)